MKPDTTLIDYADREIVCWTKMQAVAGEPLDFILLRKENERKKNNGVFLWGVGNSLGKSRREAFVAERKRKGSVPIVFSILLSRPKEKDKSPDSNKVLVWQHYIDSESKKEVPLPKGVLMTSTAKKYYALRCCSEDSLELRYGRPFDPSAFRNVGTNRPLGHSQVTSLIQRVCEDGKGGKTHQNIFPSYLYRHRVNMKALLLDWVELANPIEKDIRDVHLKTEIYKKYMGRLHSQR